LTPDERLIAARSGAPSVSMAMHDDATTPIREDTQGWVDRQNKGAELFGPKARRRRVKSIADCLDGNVLVIEGHAQDASEEPEPIDAPGERAYSIEIVTGVRDFGAGKMFQTQNLAGHASPLTSARFTPDGKRVVSASVGRLIRVWDPRSGDELFALTGHR